MIQIILTLKMTTAQVVVTSVTVNNNSPIQGYVHPDDQTQPTFEFFSVLELKIYLSRDYYFKKVNSYHKNGPCFMILALLFCISFQVICTIVAVLLHYFLLVSFAWMLVEGVYLYIMVITVFESSKEHLRIYGTCSYGKAFQFSGPG